ncbi:2Fe-2S iron-sulfur cluster-binding protein [Streptomyces sp. NPDC005322]|uniref:2Fe-2S iron-sulfur cluster-binding protein n=1 Tax=Streptomyces sp. NPDC005322 TaxID=3157032 RepID=UPI0033BAF553
MSEEQQPHRPEPGSGWQPMPHGPEYDAESTAFVQLPPDYQAYLDQAGASGGWDPLAAPGTGYTPPPMTGAHGTSEAHGAPGAPSQGGHWQPAPQDPATTGHWNMPAADPDGSGGYGYGGHQDPHGEPHDVPQGAGQWPAPAEDQPHTGHPPHTGHWPAQATEGPVDDWPLPASPTAGGVPVHTSQWTIPVAGDEGVDETGEYRVDDHPGPAAPPYGGQAGPPDDRQDPQTTAQLRMPFADQARRQEQPGHTGQWSIPAADEGVEDSGEYAVEGHPGPVAPPAASAPAPARRPLRMPDVDTPAPGGAPGWPAPGDSGEFSVEGQHTGLHTPPHGSPAPGLPQDRPAQDGLPQEAGWHGEFPGDVHGHAPHSGPDDGAGPAADAGDGPDETPESAADHERIADEEEFTGAAEAPEASAPAEAPAEAPEAADAPAEPLPDSVPDGAGAADGPAQPGESHSEHPLASYVLRVNGADRPVTEVWIGESLLYVLRERLGLAGAKDGCSQGECGACSVQVDGRLVASCLVPAATAAGCEVRTVEGLAVDGQPSDVQRALAECGAVQCGFCVPGLAMTVHDLLEGNHAPTPQETRQAICGNLCRCSGYRGVLDAVRDVVENRRAAEEAAQAAAEESGEHGDHQDPARIPHQAGPYGAQGTTGRGSVNGSGTGRASA